MLIYICIYISLKNVLVFTVCIETIHIHIDITYLHTYVFKYVHNVWVGVLEIRVPFGESL